MRVDVATYLLGAENFDDEAGVDAECTHGTVQEVCIALIRVSDEHLRSTA